MNSLAKDGEDVLLLLLLLHMMLLQWSLLVPLLR